jgi:hypothetical protein
MWIEDPDWVSDHLCRPALEYRKYTPGSVEDIISNPLAPRFGRKLAAIFRKARSPNLLGRDSICSPVCFVAGPWA